MGLGQRFLSGRARVDGERARTVDEGSEAALRRVVERVRAAWPDADGDDGDVVEELAAHMGPVDGDLTEALASLHAADLYLACACARGVVPALLKLEKHFVSQVPVWVARIDRSPAFADDVCQKLRESLLIGDAHRKPRIASYTGRGALAGWLRVVAIRTALNVRRAGRAGRGAGAPAALDAVGAGAPDPELDYLKAKYKEEFRDAFVGALARLSAEQRGALRFHYLDGLSLEDTAAACRVHRATAARWLAGARANILADTRKLLAERLRMSGEELESVFRLVESQLEVSMHRYLQEPSVHDNASS
jgi:RNA polymerase sigma-70 factor, ECF subfamily